MQEILDFNYKEQGKDNFINRKHTHTYYFEMLHIHSGSGIIMVNDRLFPIKKDTIVLINGIDTHCSVPDDPSKYERSKLVISNALIQNIAEITGASDMIRDLFIDTNGICIELRPEETALIDAEMRKIRDHLKTESIYQKTNIMLSVFKILICAHKNMHHYASTIDNKMSDVLHYLNTNIDRKITLEELCSQFHISKYYLCHTFKNTIGMTIFDYILARRISIAARKLLYTEDSLAEIALSTGFSSFSYFSKMFKEFEGVSPKDFRKANSSST